MGKYSEAGDTVVTGAFIALIRHFTHELLSGFLMNDFPILKKQTEEKDKTNLM